MNEYDIKRLERDLHSTQAQLDKPLFQQILINTLVWALIMGPIIFLITKYEKGVEYQWEQLPKSMIALGLGGVVYTLFMHAFHIWIKKRIEKKLGKKN
jgi:hypothetical protein